MSSGFVEGRIEVKLRSVASRRIGPCWVRKYPGRLLALTLAGSLQGPARAAVGLEEVEEFLSHDFHGYIVQPQLDLGATYVDNLNFNQGSEALADLQIGISPGLRLRRGDLTGNFLSVEGTHDEILFLDHSAFDYQQNHFKMNGLYKTARMRFDGTESYELLSGFLGGILGQSGAINVLPRRRDQSSGFYRATYDWTERTDFYGDFQHYATDWSKSIALYDYNTLRGAVGGSYEFTDRIRFFSEIFYGQSGVSANVANQVRGIPSSLLGGFFGTRGVFTEHFSGTAKVGLEHRNFFDASRVGVIIPAFDSDLRYEFSDSMAVTLIYSRRTSPSVNFGGQNATVDSATLSLTKRLGMTGTWLAKAGTTYQRVDYSNSAPAGRPSTARSDDFVNLEAAVTYQPRPWLTSSLGYTFENYHVSFANPLLDLRNLTGYQANRIFLNLSIGF